MLVLPLLLAGCPGQQGRGDAERVETLRRGYEVALNAWLLKDAQAGAPAPTPGLARAVEVIVDVQVTQKADDGLPGLTLEVVHLDAFGKAKRSWRRYVELPKLGAGESQAIRFVEQVEDFVDGDTFAVALAREVAPAERSAYQEFT